jgi:hypothetical protein
MDIRITCDGTWQRETEHIFTAQCPAAHRGRNCGIHPAAYTDYHPRRSTVPDGVTDHLFDTA